MADGSLRPLWGLSSKMKWQGWLATLMDSMQFKKVQKYVFPIWKKSNNFGKAVSGKMLCKVVLHPGADVNHS